MDVYYTLLTQLKTELQKDKFCNTVTTGDINDVDLTKSTIYPMSHIIVNDAVPKSNVLSFSVSIISMDIVDDTKEEPSGFDGNNNEQDVFNTQLAVQTRLSDKMRRGTLSIQNFVLDGDPICEKFTDRFTNKVAGWTMTFNVQLPNTTELCDDVEVIVECPDAIYRIKDTHNNTLYEGVIGSGGVLNQVITDATVSNSNDTFLTTVIAQGNLELADESYEIYVNGVLNQTFTIPALETETINITA